jgi:hypothetical protein
MKRIKNSQTLVSLGMFSLAFGNIASWIMRRHAAVPFWTDFGDMTMGLFTGAAIALIFLGFRMKTRPAC